MNWKCLRRNINYDIKYPEMHEYKTDEMQFGKCFANLFLPCWIWATLKQSLISLGENMDLYGFNKSFLFVCCLM